MARTPHPPGTRPRSGSPDSAAEGWRRDRWGARRTRSTPEDGGAVVRIAWQGRGYSGSGAQPAPLNRNQNSHGLGGAMASVRPNDLQKALSGVEYPADTEQLKQVAQRNHAP